MGDIRLRQAAAQPRWCLASTALDALGLACYISYSYLFWDSPLLLDRVTDASGSSIAHELLLIQGVFTGLAAFVLMFAWGKAAPLRHNAALLATLALLESLSVAFAALGEGDAAVALALAGFAMSGFGSVMRLGWEERFSVRGVSAVAVRAALAYVLGTAIYVVTMTLDGTVALVVVGTLPALSLVLLFFQGQRHQGEGVVLPDPAIEPLGPQESLRSCFQRVPWRIPAFVALSYACFGATRMNMLADSLLSDTKLGPISPSIAMCACAVGIVLAYLSYRKSVQVGICIAVPIMAVAGVINLVGGAQNSPEILFVTNVGVEMTKYIMLFLMVDVIVKDGAPALMCLALLRFAQWVGSALGQFAADVLPSGAGVLVVIMLALAAALLVTIGTLPRSVATMLATPDATQARQTGARVNDVRVDPATDASRGVQEAPVLDVGEVVEVAARRFKLSPRETEVLSIWATGRTAEYVERTLFISKSTVKTHLTHIYAKTGTSNREELLELLGSLSDADSV